MANTPTIFDEGKVPKEAFKEVGHGTFTHEEDIGVSREIGVASAMSNKTNLPTQSKASQ